MQRRLTLLQQQGGSSKHHKRLISKWPSLLSSLFIVVIVLTLFRSIPLFDRNINNHELDHHRNGFYVRAQVMPGSNLMMDPMPNLMMDPNQQHHVQEVKLSFSIQDLIVNKKILDLNLMYHVGLPQTPGTVTVSTPDKNMQHSMINFLQFLNHMHRTDLFHPLTDSEKFNGKFKALAQNIIGYVLTPGNAEDGTTNDNERSPILKLFKLSQQELDRMDMLMNKTQEQISTLSEEFLAQYVTRMEPVEYDEEAEQKVTMTSHVQEEIEKLKNFLIQIARIYKTQRINLRRMGLAKGANNEPAPNRALKYVVIGSGPVGLLSAIEASLILPKVYIIEKRTTFSRDVWFDLYPQPFSQSVELLEELGFPNELPNLEVKLNTVADTDGKERTTYTIRCQMTQRFLTKVTFLLDNVQHIFGYQYINQCKTKPGSTSSSASQSWTSRWSDLKIEPNAEYAVANFLKTNNKDCSSTLDFMSSSEQLDLCSKSETVSFTTTNGKNCELEKIPFDILIGSDGLYSTVRSSLNISTHDIHSFDVSNTVYARGLPKPAIPKITVKPKLEQVALIINFKSVGQRDCPDTAIDEDTGEFIDPWKPSLLLPNICSVFKRFYAGHCHMQILFDNEYGQKAIEKYMSARRKALNKLLQESGHNNVNLNGNANDQPNANDNGDNKLRDLILDTEAKEIRSAAFADASRDSSYVNSGTSSQEQKFVSNWEEEAFDWDKILTIVNTVLANKYETIDAFRKAIVSSDTFTGDKQLQKQFDMVLLRVVLQKAENLTTTIALDNPSSPFAVNILKGDSVASAHFRLGVGVNNAFLAFGELTSFIQQLYSNNFASVKIPSREALEKQLSQSLSEYEGKAQFRWNRLINYMATAMYFESFCDTVVFIDPGEYFGVQTIQEKDYDNLDYIPFDNLLQIRRFCQNHDKLSVWWN